MLHRDKGDAPFSERDRLLLTLFRPHVIELRDCVQAQRRGVPSLTPRQTELLSRFARGDTSRRLARDLGVSEGTVLKHLENIMTPCADPSTPTRCAPGPGPATRGSAR